MEQKTRKNSASNRSALQQMLTDGKFEIDRKADDKETTFDRRSTQMVTRGH